jgi:hypothetical protein
MRARAALAREATLFTVGLAMGAANVVRHRLRGYVTPRPFAASDVTRTVEHALGVVNRLTMHGSIDWTDKRVLEIGPGSDLATGAVVLDRGASRYQAIDLFDNRHQAAPELYPALANVLQHPVGEDRLEFCQTAFPHLPDVSGEWDLIVSNATLEHIEEIPALFRRLAELASPTARMVHHIDAQTHMRWIKERDPWNILRYPPLLYDRVLRFPGAPNRLLSGDYLCAARSTGWSAATICGDLEAEEAYLRRTRLARRFRRTDGDLRFLTFTLIADRDQTA